MEPQVVKIQKKLWKNLDLEQEKTFKIFLTDVINFH